MYDEGLLRVYRGLDTQMKGGYKFDCSESPLILTECQSSIPIPLFTRSKIPVETEQKTLPVCLILTLNSLKGFLMGIWT